MVAVPLTIGGLRDGDVPGAAFYVFATLGLLSALRMITHHRPVYSALYFIMTIVSTAGLFLLLSAEFMAFALIIIYAGAILITYLFVIMLATQAPTEGDEEHLASYDTEAREPWAASAAGFLVIGVVTALMYRGIQAPRTGGLVAGGPSPGTQEILVELPRKAERVLREAGVLTRDERLARAEVPGTLALSGDGSALGSALVASGPSGAREIRLADLPEGVRDELIGTNVERLGINLLRDHPMTIEIAGVVLLMAMLGATVLARKHVELEDALKRAEERRLQDARTARAGGEL
jgi:NADH-quinone oxidoreductase subunit J